LNIARQSNESFSSDQDLVLYNLFFWAQNSKKIKTTPIIQNGKVTEFKVDEVETRKNLASLPKADVDWLIGTTLYFYNKAIVQAKEYYLNIKTDPPAIFLKNMYPTLTVQEAVKKEVDKASANLQYIQNQTFIMKSMLGASKAPVVQTAIEEARRGIIGETMMRAILEFNDRFSNSTAFFEKKPDNPFLSRAAPTLKQIMSKFPPTETLITMSKAQDEVTRQKAVKENQDCYFVYLFNRELLPTPIQISEAQKDIALAKNLVKTNFLSKYSAHTRSLLGPLVDKIDFALPPSKDEMEKSFASTLETMIREKELSQQFGREMNPKEVAPLALITLAQLVSKKEESQEADEPWCAGFKYNPLSDANYTALGAVQASYTIVRGTQDARLGVVMHEIGHSLFRSLKDGKGISQNSAGTFQAQEKCLNVQHTEPLAPTAASNPIAAIQAALIHSNEDFADMVSASSGTSKYTSNPFCVLQEIGEDGKYKDGDMYAKPQDPHSSDLYRLLHYQAVIGKPLPKACIDLSTKNTVKFGSCVSTAVSQ